VIVIDTSALIAILRREPEADLFLQCISEADGCLFSSVSFLETSTVLAGRSGDATSWTELDLLIARAEIQVVAQDAELAQAARAAFLRYGRGRHPASLNLGDCSSYALAKHRNLPLLFKGDDFPRTDLSSAACDTTGLATATAC
jgi:ribonuclease VapC